MALDMIENKQFAESPFTLQPEALEAARKSAEKVWAKAMRFLGEGNKEFKLLTLDDPSYADLFILGDIASAQGPYKEFDVDLTIRLDSFSPGIKKDSTSYSKEEYFFCRTDGGHVIVKTSEIIFKKVQVQEADGDKLDALLKIMEEKVVSNH
jgi:hypothetical protein